MAKLEPLKVIKQKPPFLMVDSILEYEYGKYVKGKKNVTINEPYFQGHFKDFPVMPGVLITEAAAQVSTVLFYDENQKQIDDENLIPMLLKIEEMKFLKPVFPGDTLIIESKVIMKSDTFAQVKVTVSCDDRKAAKGILCFSFINKADL